MDDKINNNIVIDRTLISRLTALTLIAGMFLFIAGYFLGKKQGVRDFLQTFEHESFADQIYTGLQNLYPLDVLADDESLAEMTNKSNITNDIPNNEQIEPKEASEKGYYANIIGFRTRKAVEHFRERLNKKSIEVVIKERHSTTIKGKKIIWYQVSTPIYTDKAALVDSIERIKKVENVKEISMRTV